MTIYEGLTLGVVVAGMIFVIIGFAFSRTKEKISKDDAAMEDDDFRRQINLVNEKVLELGDYHNFIKEEIEKKHKELLYLYQMISEKEKDVRKIQMEIEQLQMGTATVPQEVFEENADKVINFNRRIIDLREQGYNAREIAQILDIGTGEVNLVLNLYE